MRFDPLLIRYRASRLGWIAGGPAHATTFFFVLFLPSSNDTQGLALTRNPEALSAGETGGWASGKTGLAGRTSNHVAPVASFWGAWNGRRKPGQRNLAPKEQRGELDVDLLASEGATVWMDTDILHTAARANKQM
jgi:hypothetical protein